MSISASHLVKRYISEQTSEQELNGSSFFEVLCSSPLAFLHSAEIASETDSGIEKQDACCSSLSAEFWSQPNVVLHPLPLGLVPILPFPFHQQRASKAHSAFLSAPPSLLHCLNQHLLSFPSNTCMAQVRGCRPLLPSTIHSPLPPGRCWFATYRTVEATLGWHRHQTNAWDMSSLKMDFICALFEGLQNKMKYMWHEATLASCLGSLSRLRVPHCNFGFTTLLMTFLARIIWWSGWPKPAPSRSQSWIDGFFSRSRTQPMCAMLQHQCCPKSMVMFLTSAMPAMRSKV